MEDRERDFDARLLLGLVNVDGNAAAVVDDGDGVVGMDRDRDVGREACECLVHRVVHHFVDEMVQPARRHRADVHRRPAADRFQAFEDLDGIRLVIPVPFFRLGRHQIPSVKEASVLW